MIILKKERSKLENTKNPSKIRQFADSISAMFALEENKNTIHLDFKGDFVIYKKELNKQYATPYYNFTSIMRDERIENPVMALKRYKNDTDKANLALAYELNAEEKEYLRTKYAVHGLNLKGLNIVKFTSFKRSLENGDLQEIVIELITRFNESDRKVSRSSYLSNNALNMFIAKDRSKIKSSNFGFSFNHYFDSSFYEINYNTKLEDTAKMLHDNNLTTAAFLSSRHQYGKSRYMRNQLLKQVEEEKLPEIDYDFDPSYLRKINKLTFKDNEDPHRKIRDYIKMK